MHIEYKTKIKLLRTILVKSQEEFSRYLGYDNVINGSKVVSFYETGYRIPSEKTIHKLCENLEISYDFFSNYNYALNQEERVMAEILWLELYLLYNNLPGLSQKQRDDEILNNDYTPFTFSSLKLKKYMIEYLNIKSKNIDSNKDFIIKYILKFPYSSSSFEIAFDKVAGLPIKSSIDLNVKYPLLNFTFKEKFLRKINLFSNVDTIDLNINNEDISEKYMDTPIQIDQILDIQKAIGNNIIYLLDICTDIENIRLFVLNNIVWNDIYKNIDTIIKPNENDYQFYFNDNEFNMLLNKYFNCKEKYITKNINYVDYVFDMLSIYKSNKI